MGIEWLLHRWRARRYGLSYVVGRNLTRAARLPDDTPELNLLLVMLRQP